MAAKDSTKGERPLRPPLVEAARGRLLCGHVAMWLCGSVVMWLCGYEALWLCGYVAMWLFGYVAKFQNFKNQKVGCTHVPEKPKTYCASRNNMFPSCSYIFDFVEAFWYIRVRPGHKNPEIMKMFGFGPSHNKTKILLDQIRSE